MEASLLRQFATTQLENYINAPLLPGEALVWLSAFDARYPLCRTLKDEAVKAASAVLFFASFMYVVIAALLNYREGVLYFSDFVSWVVLISTGPLSVIGVIALIRFMRNRAPKLPPLLPAEYLFALSNNRAIVYSVRYLSMTSVPLENVEIVLEPLKRGYGNIRFYPYSKKLAPVWNTFPRATPLAALTFEFVPQAAEVYRLARETQSTLRGGS